MNSRHNLSISKNILFSLLIFRIKQFNLQMFIILINRDELTTDLTFSHLILPTILLSLIIRFNLDTLISHHHHCRLLNLRWSNQSFPLVCYCCLIQNLKQTQSAFMFTYSIVFLNRHFLQNRSRLDNRRRIN